MNTAGKEWYIAVPWGRMSVVAWGNCLEQPVLLVHGKGDNASSFMPLISLLPQKFYYVAIELPGCGKSDRFPQGMMITMHELVYVIDAVVKHFHWKNFIYVGHGLGAIVGKLFNYSVPKKITKLIEIEPIEFIAINPETFKNWYHDHFTNYFKNYQRFNTPIEMTPKTNIAQLVATLKDRRKISKEAAASLIQRCTKPTAEYGFVRYAPDLRYSLIPPLPFTAEWIRTVFLNITTPTLDIITTESLKLNRYKNTTFLQDESNYPHKNYKCVKVEGSYDIQIQNPGKIAPFIGQFLLGGVAAVSATSKL